MIENKFLIKEKKDSYVFNYKKYNPLLSDLIDEKGFSKIIMNINKIMRKSLEMKRERDNFDLPMSNIVFSIIALILMIAFIILIYVSNRIEDGNNLFYISIGLISVSILIVLIQSIYNFIRRLRVYIPLIDLINNNLNLYLEEINNTHYFLKTNSKYSYLGSIFIKFIPASDNKKLQDNYDDNEYGHILEISVRKNMVELITESKENETINTIAKAFVDKKMGKYISADELEKQLNKI